MRTSKLSRGLGAVLASRPLRPLAYQHFARRCNIVYYHGIRTDEFSLLSALTTQRLEADLKRLQAHFRFVTLPELLEHNATAARATKPLLAVTFDDGLELVRSGAMAVLNRLEVPATAFVVSQSIDNRELLWNHRVELMERERGLPRLLAALNDQRARPGAGAPVRSRRELTQVMRSWPLSARRAHVEHLWSACDMPSQESYLRHAPYMTWSDLQVWCDHGHQVGLHTASHAFCSGLGMADLETELFAPGRALGTRLGLSSLPFAYPFGDRLAPALERSVARSGLFTCLLGIGGFSRLGTSPFQLGRVSGESGAVDSVFGKSVLQELSRRLRSLSA